DWYQSIPERIRQSISKYRHIDFAILYLTSHYHYAYELYQSHPKLFWFVLCEAKQQQWSEEKLVAVISMPRKDMMGQCSLPATKAAVRLLTKFDFERYDITALSLIKKVFELKSYQKINHHSVINLKLAKLMVRHPALIRPTFLHKLKEDEWNSHISNTLNDIFRMAEQLEVRNIIDAICGCNSNCELITVHDQLVRLQNQRMAVHAYKQKFDIAFPSPPISGAENIIPIENGLVLIQEGVEQKHCEASYHDDILSGEYYVYQVLSPERATLGLRLTYGQRPKLDQLFLKMNKQVSEETRLVITHWLTQS
ncbi:MAG: hypothetical protein GQ547_08715, partial [Methylophaga sp.]|nr:hypothetical protein [Methylophaga sp.]